MEYTLFGNGMDRMPDFAFRGMAFLFLFWDFFREITSQFSRRLASFGIESGPTVIDYGCGPGGYLKAASSLVGHNGKVYAVDIHPLAIEAVRKKIAKYGLRNVTPILTNKYRCSLGDRTADVIYALDMFHMIKNPNDFLSECHRLLKKEGHLIIDDGHQSRKETKPKNSRFRTLENCRRNTEPFEVHACIKAPVQLHLCLNRFLGAAEKAFGHKSPSCPRTTMIIKSIDSMSGFMTISGK